MVGERHDDEDERRQEHESSEQNELIYLIRKIVRNIRGSLTRWNGGRSGEIGGRIDKWKGETHGRKGPWHNGTVVGWIVGG